MTRAMIWTVWAFGLFCGSLMEAVFVRLWYGAACFGGG